MVKFKGMCGAAAVAILVAGIGALPVPARAETARAARDINIPAGSLGNAIAQLGRKAGVMIVFDPALVRGRRTAGLRGSYTPEQALNALLANSGLTARPDNNGGFVLSAVTADPRRSTASRPPARRPAASPAPDGPQAREVEDIIVTGEKFARNQFNTFTSVEVVTAEDLDKHVRRSLDEAVNSSPNIRMFESSGNTNIAIRGMNAEGPTQPSRSNPVISVIVDGAEQGIEATRRGTSGVWDVEQIEVLRGPQSTLQARTALAGALIIKTKNPTFAPEAIVRGDIDSDGLYSGAFAVSGAVLEDQLAIRLSGQVTRDDKGITYSDPKYASLGKEKFEQFRGKLLFVPNALPGFTGLFTVSRTHDKPAYNLVTGPDYFDRKYTTGLFEEFRDTVVWRYIADLKYEINADWAVQSVTAFVDTKVEIDAPRTATYFRDETRAREDFSQDIRLTYGSEESAFSGVLGLYAGQYSNHAVSDSEMDLFGLGFTIPLQQLESRDKGTSFAVYADGRYRFMDRWTLLAGGRLLHDKISANYKGVVLAGLLDATLDEISSVSNTELLPKIGLAFALSENQNIALTASKGYRPGFSEHILGTDTINTVKPESLWAYELAYRSKWIDDRLQINGNVFYYDNSNMQVPVPVPDPILSAGYSYTINAGKAHSYGAELEARWNFDSGLEVFAGLGLLKTKFDEAEYNGVSISGSEFTEAPSLTASLGANYRHHSGWFVGGNIAYTDGYYSKGDVQNRPAYAVDSFTVANAQAGYANELLTVAVYAKNLLNEKYLTGIGSNGATADLGDARAVGLQVTLRF